MRYLDAFMYPGKQERTAWLSESDVDFFTGGAPQGESKSEIADPEAQQTVQVFPCHVLQVIIQ